MNVIAAGEFKAKCLKIMDLVTQNHEEYLITKHGKPVAKISPLENVVDPFGFLKGSVHLEGDIVVSSLEEPWDASV